MIATNWRCFSRSFAVMVALGVLLFLGSAYGRLDVGFSARTDQAEVSLLAALQGLDTKQQDVLFGLEFVLQPGWKIYWRAPGAGGKPPELHWHEGSQNIAGLTIQWPFPQRFRTYGLLSNGYGGRVILPLLVQRQDPSQPMTLDMVVDFFICKDICIPDRVHVTRTLTLGAGAESRDARRIAAAQELVPVTGVTTLSVSSPEALSGHDGRLRVNWEISSPVALAEVVAFFDAEAEFSESLLNFNQDRTRLSLSAEAKDLQAEQSVALVLATRSLHSGETTYSRHEFSRVTTEALSWGWVLMLALVGGVLINVMPCVLPVLMVKLFGALSCKAQHSRRGFLAMSAGIVTAFGLLGQAFAVIRAGGGVLHWGMQFQQPLFLSAMVFVLVAFAAQLLGWWTLRLPRFFSARAPQANGVLSEFFIGMIATVLATPCSAPLVGVVVSLALFLEPVQMILILLVMGLGMALPYLVLAMFPVLLRWLPRPGAWMNTLKFLLALSVLGTALWVLWLLSGQIGAVGAMTIMSLAGLVLFALAMAKFPDTKIAPHRIKLALLLMLIGFAVPGRFAPAETTDTLSQGWQVFTPETINAHVAAGKTVLVDVSADWCITCLVNNQLVFDQPEVLQWRQRPDVVAMRGDWSRPDLVIKAFLARFQRQALPFAVLFTPRAPEGMLLPELIRMADFRGALIQTAAPPLPQ